MLHLLFSFCCCSRCNCNFKRCFAVNIGCFTCSGTLLSSLSCAAVSFDTISLVHVVSPRVFFDFKIACKQRSGKKEGKRKRFLLSLSLSLSVNLNQSSLSVLLEIVALECSLSRRTILFIAFYDLSFSRQHSLSLSLFSCFFLWQVNFEFEKYANEKKEQKYYLK